jgi:hypothetical protein
MHLLIHFDFDLDSQEFRMRMTLSQSSNERRMKVNTSPAWITEGNTGALVNDFFSPKINPISSRASFTDVAHIFFNRV